VRRDQPAAADLHADGRGQGDTSAVAAVAGCASLGLGSFQEPIVHFNDAKIRGEESIGGFSHYKLELHPDGVSSQYGTVLAWIGVRSGALAKAECYGRNGKLIARFTVVSVRRLSDGTGIFKSMRIERMVDGKEKDSAPSYLEITGEGV